MLTQRKPQGPFLTTPTAHRLISARESGLLEPLLPLPTSLPGKANLFPCPICHPTSGGVGWGWELTPYLHILFRLL